MSEQKDFFSPNHKQLLNIATWAKYLAWVVLVVYIFSAGTQIIQLILLKDNVSFVGQTSQSFLTMLRDNPFNAFKMLVTIATTLLKGFIYYLVLKGTSSALNMIVETNINYRERNERQNEQRIS